MTSRDASPGTVATGRDGRPVRDPMSLFELQAWLRHPSPQLTQHYARLTPVTLTEAYTDAGYFAGNVRTIEVLLDRDVITNGQSVTGGPFEFYDLGPGCCSYSFFEQCPHPMAYARCDFYAPKLCSQAHLVKANGGLQRMLVQIPLTDEERAAAEKDHDAVDRPLGCLIDTPAPAGPTPRDLNAADPGRGHARCPASEPRLRCRPLTSTGRRHSSPAAPACPDPVDCLHPSVADRRPDGFKVDLRLPSPRPCARFRVRRRLAFRATSTTGSPQGGTKDERLSTRR